MLRIAVAKGHAEKCSNSLSAAAFILTNRNKTRKLILRDRNEKLELILTKPVDTTVYVETGAADCGIVGKDILLENDADVYSLLSLGIARCKMRDALNRRVSANIHYCRHNEVSASHRKNTDEKNIDCKIIYLSGSVERRRSSILPIIAGPCPDRHHAQENDLVVADDIIEDVCACFIATKSV